LPPLRGRSVRLDRRGAEPQPLSRRRPARPFDAPRIRSRISRYPARCRAAPSRLSKDRPSVDITSGVHSRLPWLTGDLARVRLHAPEPSASGYPALRTFRPRGLSPPRRFAPPAVRGLVASHYRPWGSPGFCAPPSADWRKRFPSDATPSRAYPPAQPLLRHRRPFPSCRFGIAPSHREVPSTSRSCSARASVAPSHRCRWPVPVALLGFPFLEHHVRSPPLPRDHPKIRRCWLRPGRPSLGDPSRRLFLITLRPASSQRGL